MNWKSIVALMVAAPILALFGGAGLLAWQVGATWTEATTASLITGMVTVCGGGAVVVALILSLIVGIPMATRYFAEQGVARKAWGDGHAPQPQPPMYVYPTEHGARYPALPALRQQPGWREAQPPAVQVDAPGGSWSVADGAAYDLWDDGQSSSRADFPDGW